MRYIRYYDSPIGKIVMIANENAITGIYFENQRYFPENIQDSCIEQETVILHNCAQWLNDYFQGNTSVFPYPLDPKGTPFQKRIWNILMEIPYGTTWSYAKVCERYCTVYNVKTMSIQAVGSAIGHNPVSILIPCHRVIGSNGKLTGYAGGLDRKKYLLELEKNNQFYE
ncbi:MAG: methylated-DNA--[protein]-cysteine S-methyltransferase [Bulleidia sp.]|nr:methylated-DNA--[protein]-cysteine S-methyltransferase [Bulleidia sp.]